MDKDIIEISGTVQSIIYQNEENGYTVLKVESTDGEEFNAVGCLPFAVAGEQVILFGEWTRHPSHGEQFKIEWAERLMPSGAEAIFDYLASRVIKGVGPATASLIVNMFGDKTLEVIERNPEKLVDIKGISLKRAKEISESFKRQVGMRRLIEFLYQHSIAPQIAMRLYQYYGDNALALVEENPFIICTELIGGKFSEADSLALNLGMEGTSAPRICAAIIFELFHNLNNGHSFIPRNKLAMATAQLIEVDIELVSAQIDELVASEEIITEKVVSVEACYLRKLYVAEQEVAERLLKMAKKDEECKLDIDKTIDEMQKTQEINYAQMQVDTIKTAATAKVMALTGGPGTGKTTCVRAILELFDKLKLEAFLAAPTGRASKRMSELCGREAFTIHRLLETGYSKDGELVFKRNAKDPLRCDAIILDECSMVDIVLMQAVVSALPKNARLILVGDADQLPSVGAGNVFLDIIRSNKIKTVRLTEIFRQSEESYIVKNAHMINHGEHPDLSEKKNGFFFLKRPEAQSAVETIVELCQTRLPQNMKIPVTDIQVLTPTRRTELGTVSLNKMLQQHLNPQHEKKKEKMFGEIVFREGDRVMQIRNNYDILWQRVDTAEVGAGIFNGDIGFITEINLQSEDIKIDFDGKLTSYGFDMLMELEHAYAMTVHKSQGSEYRAVILSACRSTPMLLSRGVLYTAATRARELLIIVGDDRVVHYMIDNHRQTRRYSGLRARLAGEIVNENTEAD